MQRRAGWIGIIAVCALFFAAPAFAQMGYGVRAGLSADPGQFHFGGHVETKPIFDKVTFRPNAELGFGDHLTLFTANLEFVYPLELQNKPARVYLGAGPAISIWSYDDEFAGFDDNNAGGGFNILAGVQHNKGIFGEVKIGFGDVPQVKFTVGYSFK
jgi:hypothetical protein